MGQQFTLSFEELLEYRRDHIGTPEDAIRYVKFILLHYRRVILIIRTLSLQINSQITIQIKVDKIYISMLLLRSCTRFS